MAADLTPERYAQFRLITQALHAATYAGVAGADDAAREFEALQRDFESRPARHWVDAIIESESATYGGVLN